MDSPNAAMRLVEEALDLADTLAEMSERGRLVPELTDGIHRELFIKRYRMIYRVGADHVAIVAFVHGARDFRSWWKQHRKPN